MYAKTMQRIDQRRVGCNAAIAYLKEHLKIGAPIYMQTGRSGSFGCSELAKARTYTILNKYPKFVECGIQLENGKYISEFFLYQDVLEQHGLPNIFSPYMLML